VLDELFSSFVFNFKLLPYDMAIMAYRMATEELWDQAGYNLELWFGARDAHATAGPSRNCSHRGDALLQSVTCRYMYCSSIESRLEL